MTFFFAIIFCIALTVSGTRAKHVQHKKLHFLKHDLKAKSGVNAQSDDFAEIVTSVSAMPAVTEIPVNPRMLEERLQAIESSVSRNQASMSVLESSLSAILADLVASLDAMQASITTNQESISSHDSSISAHEGSIAANLASITDNVNGISTLRNELQGLASKSRSFCQTGTVESGSVGEDNADSDSTKSVERTVTFPTPFPSYPEVKLALSAIKMVDYNTNPDSGNGDWVGWALIASDITNSSFTATIYSIDTRIEALEATWIACVTV